METKTKLPEFKGKPLIEIPENIPQAGFLEGDFGEAFLEEYQGRTEADYNGNSTLNVLAYRDNVVKGSNPFAVVLANQILREEGLRTATQADLERVLRTNALDLRGVLYEDTGLVLRSEKDDYSQNTSLAQDIGSQLKARGIKFNPKNPVMVPLIGLELETTDNDYGLTFKLREDVEIYEVPVLNKSGNFNSEDINEKIGLPRETGRVGNRYLHTRDSGLSRLCLYGGLDLSFYDVNLDDSSRGGRVVVVSGEATAPER